MTRTADLKGYLETYARVFAKTEMTNAADIERRLETWMRFLNSQMTLSDFVTWKMVSLPDATLLVHDLQAVLDYLRHEDRRTNR